MTVFVSKQALVWGELDLPLLGIDRDWHGASVAPAVMCALAMDADRLWFVASHRKPATLHPHARPGGFLAELWRYDVAELFLADPPSGRYVEFNLAPNGAWWSCRFTGPRERAPQGEQPLAGVETFADLAPDGAWLAAAAIPLAELRTWPGFAAGTTGNITFILGSPQQRFLTASPLGPGEPDFHRPDRFPVLRFLALPQDAAAG